MRRGNLVWSGQESATQIKTIDTLVVIQTEPGVAWHGILGLSVFLWEKAQENGDVRQKDNTGIYFVFLYCAHHILFVVVLN